MKIRLNAIIFIFALAASSWAQTATSSKANPDQSSTAAAQATTKAECPCCKADGKAAASCCARHQEGTATSDQACCKGKEGKEAMSCMKGDKQPTHAAQMESALPTGKPAARNPTKLPSRPPSRAAEQMVIGAASLIVTMPTSPSKCE